MLVEGESEFFANFRFVPLPSASGRGAAKVLGIRKCGFNFMIWYEFTL